MTEPQGDELVAVGTRLPKSLIRRLKLVALDTDRTFQAVLIEAVETFLVAREKPAKKGR